MARTKPSTTAMISPVMAWKWTALTGARVSGWTAANQRGSRVARPMAKSDRVAAVAPELAFATVLLRMAKTTSRPPSVPSTSVAMPPHGSPPFAWRNPVI